MSGAAVALALTLLLSACAGGESTPEARGARAGDTAVARDAAAVLSWSIGAPAQWDHRVVIVDAASRVDGERSASRFDYVPFDSTLRPAALLWITMYDSAAWSRLSAGPSAPEGEVIGRSPGAVYLARLPSVNPFASGSRDSTEFERRRVTRAFVTEAFRVVQ